MKAVITEIGLEILPGYQVAYGYEIQNDNNEVLLGSQSIKCLPSQLRGELKSIVDNFTAEYEANQQIQVGTEVA